VKHNICNCLWAGDLKFVLRKSDGLTAFKNGNVWEICGGIGKEKCQGDRRKLCEEDLNGLCSLLTL
jgi:hypothetical protein